jgi:putative transposase
MRGRTPAEIFEPSRGPGVDTNRLVLLMMQKEIRTITKDGISWRGRLYWHEALANRRHSVVIRYDDLSPYDVLVYTQDGDYICQARDREYYKIAAGIHPAAKALGTAEQQQDLLEAIKLKKHQEKEAAAGITAMLHAVVLPEVRAAQALPAPAADLSLKAEKPPKKPTQAEIDAIEAINARADFNANNEQKTYEPAYQRRFKNSLDKYDYLFKTIHEKEIELVPQDKAWMEEYEKSEEFMRNQKRRYDSMLKVYKMWKAC